MVVPGLTSRPKPLWLSPFPMTTRLLRSLSIPPAGSSITSSGTNRRTCIRSRSAAKASTGPDTETISRTQAWPDWHPPQEMRERDPRLPEKMTGGTRNPLGAMALYLGTTLYRIHGTNDVKSIGQAQSSGCFRMMNASVLHLAGVAGVGTMVTVVASLPKGVEVSQVPEPPRVAPASSLAPARPINPPAARSPHSRPGRNDFSISSTARSNVSHWSVG